MASILSPEHRGRLIRSATYASVSVALLLIVVKSWAWLQTGSVSLLSSLADSLLDVLASALTFWAVRFSLSPADEEHRFGHGKSEGLAALVQSIIICGSGVYVCYEALQRFAQPAAITAPETGIAVIIGATVATVLLVLYQRFVSRRTGSVAIAADAMHYKADVLVNMGVIGALLGVSITGWQPLDPLVGLTVGVYILYGAWEIASGSLDVLLDREIPDEDRENIRQIATSNPGVLGFHDMRTRHGGSNYIVQFHLELDPAISLTQTHEILDEVELAIGDAYPGCEIIIHPDPLGLKEKRDAFGLR